MGYLANWNLYLPSFFQRILVCLVVSGRLFARWILFFLNSLSLIDGRTFVFLCFISGLPLKKLSNSLKLWKVNLTAVSLRSWLIIVLTVRVSFLLSHFGWEDRDQIHQLLMSLWNATCPPKWRCFLLGQTIVCENEDYPIWGLSWTTLLFRNEYHQGLWVSIQTWCRGTSKYGGWFVSRQTHGRIWDSIGTVSFHLRSAS